MCFQRKKCCLYYLGFVVFLFFFGCFIFLQILAEESPSKISASEDSTDDSDFDDNILLSSFTPTGPPKQMACIPVFEQHGHSYSPPDDDINPESGADHTFQGLLAKAINTIENVTTVSCQRFLILKDLPLFGPYDIRT